MFGRQSWPWVFLVSAVTREWFSKGQNGQAAPPQTPAELPRCREKRDEAAKAGTYANTPVEKSFQCVWEKALRKRELATTTGGEPVRDANGGMRSRVHYSKLYIARPPRVKILPNWKRWNRTSLVLPCPTNSA